MLFDKLSPTTDFISKLQSQISVLNANVLYITHMQDKILKLVKTLSIDKDLQNTVDQYFDEDGEPKTSPQTDTGKPGTD